MKTNKIWNWISGFLLLVQAAIEALLTVNVLRLNMLPDRYLIVLYVAMVALLLLTAGILFLRGKKPVSLARRIVGIIFVVLIIFACLLGAKMANEGYQTLHKVTNDPVELEENTMNVFVRMDDPATTLKDTAKYTYAIITEFEEDITQEALRLISEQIGETVNQTPYEDLIEMTNALLNGDVDAILINDAALMILSEDEEGYSNLFDKIRILHSFPMSQLEVVDPTEGTTPPTEPPTEPQPAAEITEEPFVVYLSGSDGRSKTLKKGRNDVNILAVVNPQTKQILLINTPRDYYVENPAGRGKLDKLTNCGIYGTENSMKTLSNLYGLPVNYYARINFTGVETLVDAIGGITVTSTESFKCGDRRQFKIVKGENYLNGEQALAFARERKLVAGGDNGRGKNQMRVITAIIKKATTGTTIISNYSEILASLDGVFRTDVPMEDISALVKMQLDDMATWNVKSFAVTGTGDSEKTYSSPGHRAYVMRPHKYMVEHATKLAQKVIAGEVLTSDDVKAPKK